MGYKIDEIEGIGPASREKLNGAGIKSTDDLLALCKTGEGRKAIAERTGLSEKHILEWTNMADLMRLSGVGRQYAELLEAAGVDTVKELRNRNAENLAKAMKQVNATTRLARTSPSSRVVARWIEQAKNTEPLISH